MFDSETNAGFSRKQAVNIAELCDRYLQAAADGDPRLLKRNGEAKKAATLTNDRGRIHAHIVPLLGSLSVEAVTRRDIEAFMLKVANGATAARAAKGPRAVSIVRGGRGAASRTVGLLGAILAFGVRLDLRADNPCRGVTRFADQRRERRLSDDEYHMLAAGLAAGEVEGANPFGLAAMQLLAITGWRRNEVTDLRWAELDLPRRTARLAATKSGVSVRPLAHAAVDLLRAIPRTTNPFVFPAQVKDRPFQGLPRMWLRIRKLAELPGDVTLHALRHSFASMASDLGYGDAAIAGLIGHRRGGVTARYTHAADSVMLRAADDVAKATLERMGAAHERGLIVELRAGALASQS